jgi:hypothetical protein
MLTIALVVMVVAIMLATYKYASGMGWFGGSLTIIWGQVLVFAGGAIEVLTQVAPVLNLPELQSLVYTSVDTKHWAAYMAIVGLITLIVRMRTL